MPVDHRWHTGSSQPLGHCFAPFARVFTEAGFAVLMHDHRGFGSGDGEPRGDIDPLRQNGDWRYAISFLESRPAVDSERIILWSSSFSGGHPLVLGATRRRINAVV